MKECLRSGDDFFASEVRWDRRGADAERTRIQPATKPLQTMTTSFRFDDASFADIQRRFREGKPNQAAKRKRHSRYDLVASLRNEIEQLLNEGYSFDGIAEYLLSLDVRIPAPTLKNYVSLARRNSGDRRRKKDVSASRNSNTASSLQAAQIGRIRPSKARGREGARDHHPISVAPPGPEPRSDEPRASSGTAPTTTSLAPEVPPLTGENVSVDEQSTKPTSAVRGPVNGHLHRREPRTAMPILNSNTQGSGTRESASETPPDDSTAPTLNETSSSFAVPRRKRLEDL